MNTAIKKRLISLSFSSMEKEQLDILQTEQVRLCYRFVYNMTTNLRDLMFFAALITTSQYI